MLASGLAVFARWMPHASSNARAIGRARNDARCLTIAKAVHRKFRSEASPQWRYSDESERARRTEPAHFDFANDTARLLTASFFAEYDVCLWAMARFFVEQVQMQTYLLMSAVFHELAGFARPFFLPAYHKYSRAWPLGIALPDVEARSRQRGLPEGEWREPTGFVREFRHVERKFLAQSLRHNPGGPHLPLVWSGKGQHRFGQAAVHGARRRGEDEEGAAAKEAEQQEAERPMYDPNYVEISGSYDRILGQMIKVATRYFDSPDQKVIARMIDMLCGTRIEAPLMDPLTEKRSSQLTFKCCAQDAVTGEYSQPQTESVPVMKVERAAGKRGASGDLCMRISTHYLMLSPYEMLYLFLTEPENKHTRPLSTVLPLQLLGYPALVHRFDVKQRAQHVLRATVPARLALMTSTGATPGVASSGGAHLRVRFEKVGPEELYFRRHLAASGYMPAFADDEGMPWTRPGVVTFRQRYAAMAAHHPDAPGRTEALVRRAVFAYPAWKETREALARYPDARRDGYKLEARAAKATASGAGAEALTPEQVEAMARDLRLCERSTLLPLVPRRRGKEHPRQDAPSAAARVEQYLRLKLADDHAPLATQEALLLDDLAAEFADFDPPVLYRMWHKQEHALKVKRAVFRRDYVKYIAGMLELDYDPVGYLTRDEYEEGKRALAQGGPIHRQQLQQDGERERLLLLQQEARQREAETLARGMRAMMPESEASRAEAALLSGDNNSNDSFRMAATERDRRDLPVRGSTSDVEGMGGGATTHGSDTRPGSPRPVAAANNNKRRRGGGEAPQPPSSIMSFRMVMNHNSNSGHGRDV